MNNNFVKDNLLPNEQIIATAKWHWMKKWGMTIILLMAGILLFIQSYIEAEIYRYYLISTTKENIKIHPNSGFLEGALDYVQTHSPWYVWGESETGILIVTFCSICFTLAIASFFIRKWLIKYDEFAITNLRVIAKVGLIRRRAFELHNEQVESIEVRQGILGRLMGFGTLIPGGVGASKVRISFVINPFEFRQHFYDLKKGQQKTIE